MIYNNFTTALGNTADSYQKAIGENASYLGQLGKPTSDVSQLLAFELQQANNALGNGVLASSIDAAAPTPGLSLTFARTYLQSIASRFTVGNFGRGWTHNWDVVATSDTDGNVTIRSGGATRTFEKRGDGSYRAQDGDYGTLRLQAGAYRLEELGGLVEVFQSDGKLSYVEDLNRNRITLGYAGTQLTSLTHSNGDQFTLTYNAQGRIAQLTDQAGQVTTYGYDLTGQTLLSTTSPSGTTGYSYESSGAGAKAYALNQITFADNTTTLFAYDTQGRLVQQTLAGGAESTTYSYDNAGGITIKDGTGASTKIWLNEKGQTARSEDALGRITQFSYDDTGNLTRVVAPGNTISNFTYDRQGNLLSSVDPLGQRVDFGYDPRFQQLSTVRDQRGNLTAYAYTNQGNLSSIAYGDGTSETYRYDTTGNLTVAVNRRSQQIEYTYDSKGQLLSKKYPDGTSATFTYDNRGNLLTAVDADSTVAYTYDPANRLTKVTQANGRFLEYTYDAGGRRTKMVDQTGAVVNYRYDAVGRLSQLTDGSNQPIITYAYDAAGRLSRETNGNGTYTTYTYDLAGQVTRIANYTASNAVNSQYDYTYDALGRRTSMTTLEGTTTYGYDATGQLTSVILPTGRRIDYAYDAAGNRTTVQDSGITTNYATNNLNEYTQVGADAYTYDADGNLTRKTQGGKTYSYTYDVENRLTQVITPDGTWNYEYDALGNRIASSKDGQRTEYLLDPTGLVDVVGEYSGTGSLIARYTHGLGLVSRSDGSNVNSYYDTDAIGSVVGLSGTTGSYLNRYSYLPFGEDLTKTETIVNPFEYVGQFGVMDEGNGFDFMRARYYSSLEGRFNNHDPIGITGGLNLYAYGYNNPVQFVDPEGLIPESIDKNKRLPPSERYRGYFGEKGQEYVDKHGPIDLRHYEASRQLAGRLNPLGPFGGPLIPFSILVTNLAGLGVEIGQYSSDNPNINESGFNTYDFISNFLGSLVGAFDLNFLSQAIASVLTAFDPNDITGPAGFGTQNYLIPTQTFPYAIRFENQASATAPAVFVTVTQQLDTDLDLTTFALGNFGFGNVYIEVPTGLQAYSTRVDLTSTIGYFVDFTAALDPTTRIVTWRLTTIDPATGGLPTDPDAGFLPPNNATHAGEGFINYSIRPNANLPTGTTIDAEARIIFDFNTPIDTPRWTNTVDVDKPSSIITALPATGPANFTVTWNGTDNGSGIASYDIYVATDGNPFVLWKDDITETSALYTGQIGRTYAFYSIARDNIGNTEAAPNTPDAQLLVVSNPGILAFTSPTFSLNEDGTAALAVTITRTGGSDGIVSTTLNLTDGSAIAPDDYANTPITVNFANGETSKTVAIPIINDTFYETNETLNLTLGNLTGGAAIGTQSTATLTIIDNDPLAVVNLLPDMLIIENAAFNFTIPSNTFNAAVSLNPTATLSNGNPLPIWLNFNATTRTFNGTPTKQSVGTLGVKVTVIAGDGSSASDIFDLTITTPSQAPTVGNTDFNRDGQSDLIWRNYATGQNAIWQMNGTTHSQGAYTTPVTDLNWSIAGTGDFNRDGQSDLVWRNYATGENAVWLMNGTTLIQGIYTTPIADMNWSIAGAGDFNRDGQSDLVWRNYATGQNAIWLMNGTNFSQGIYTTPVTDLNWSIAGTGDFNRDGQSDLVWRNYATGQNAIWLMNGTNFSQGFYITPVTDPDWSIAGTGDFNRDGQTDLIWRNGSAGKNAVWLMNGTNFSQGMYLNTDVPDANWRIGNAYPGNPNVFPSRI